MTGLVIPAAAMVVGSIITLVWLLSSARPAPVAKENLDRGYTVPTTRRIETAGGAFDRVIAPFLDRVAGFGRRFTSTELQRRLNRKLELSGLLDRGWTAERLLAVRLVLFIGSVLLLLALVTSGSSSEMIGFGLFTVLLAVLGPEATIDRMTRERQNVIQKELPDVIDQLTVSVEAGLGFDAAMARSAEGRDGPMAEELGRVVQDLRIGMPRDDALTRMVERTEVLDVRTFVTAVRQSTKHGLPVAKVLRVQSQELREKRRARLEIQAAQLPVKIVFPLVFCILPCLFAVILGPALLDIIDGF